MREIIKRHNFIFPSPIEELWAKLKRLYENLSMTDRVNLVARARKAAEVSLPKIVKDELGILNRF